MPAVSADTTQLAVVPEATAGQTPDPAPFELLRATGEGLNFSPNSTLSQELNPARQVSDSILTGAEVSGDINFELSKHNAFELLLAAALGADWNVNELKVSNLLKTFTVEKRFLTDAVTPGYHYHRFPGCAVNTMQLDIQPNQPITGSFGFTGQTLTLATAETANAAYTPAGTNPVMTAPIVDSIQLFGAAVTDCVSQITLTTNNNIRGLECIGTLGFDELSIGRFELEAQVNMYFSSNAMMQRLVDQTEGTFVMRTRDSAGNNYTWTQPRIKISGSEVVAGGTNQDVISNLTLTGLYDGTAATSLQVDRA